MFKEYTTEAILENVLIQQLAKNGYQKVLVEDEASLIQIS